MVDEGGAQPDAAGADEVIRYAVWVMKHVPMIIMGDDGKTEVIVHETEFDEWPRVWKRC